MRSAITAILLTIIVFVSAACQPEFEGRPTARTTEIPTVTPPATVTLTPTLVPTVTPSPTPTLTTSPTQVSSATPTFTPTPIPTNQAVLFPMTAGGSQIVNWSYFYISQKELRDDGSLSRLSATVAFQLLDRGIHSETLQILGQNVTVYYLRVSHTFNQTPIEIRLVLTGIFGKNIPITDIPADGSAYINLRTQNSDAVFEPWHIHQDWQLPYEQRQTLFKYILLNDFQQLLDDLPNEVILLADHAVIWYPDDWAQVKLDMTRISAEAARLEPFFTYDNFDLLLGQSTSADAWRFYLLNKQDIPADLAEDDLAFSADYLVLITP